MNPPHLQALVSSRGITSAPNQGRHNFLLAHHRHHLSRKQFLFHPLCCLLSASQQLLFQPLCSQLVASHQLHFQPWWSQLFASQQLLFQPLWSLVFASYQLLFLGVLNDAW
jgi:hypothetical protein